MPECNRMICLGSGGGVGAGGGGGATPFPRPPNRLSIGVGSPNDRLDVPWRSPSGATSGGATGGAASVVRSGPSAGVNVVARRFCGGSGTSSSLTTRGVSSRNASALRGVGHSVIGLHTSAEARTINTRTCTTIDSSSTEGLRGISNLRCNLRHPHTNKVPWVLNVLGLLGVLEVLAVRGFQDSGSKLRTFGT